MLLKIIPPLALLTLIGCSNGGADATPVEQDPAPEQQSTPPTPAQGVAQVEKTGDPAIDALADFVAEQKIDKSHDEWRLDLEQPPKLPFAEDKTYYWVLETNKGTMKLELFADAAPMHASSTVYLTKLGFYDGLKFHRVIPGFMAQGGDPLGTGSGGPGYQYDGEFLVHCPNEECKKTYFGEKTQTVQERLYFLCPDCNRMGRPERHHGKRGVLSMAHAGPGTDGSQFFITFKETSGLDSKHTVFGQLVDGTETLGRLERAGTPSGPPQEELVIEKASIVVE